MYACMYVMFGYVMHKFILFIQVFYVCVLRYVCMLCMYVVYVRYVMLRAFERMSIFVCMYGRYACTLRMCRLCVYVRYVCMCVCYARM